MGTRGLTHFLRADLRVMLSIPPVTGVESTSPLPSSSSLTLMVHTEHPQEQFYPKAADLASSGL